MVQRGCCAAVGARLGEVRASGLVGPIPGDRSRLRCDRHRRCLEHGRADRRFRRQRAATGSEAGVGLSYRPQFDFIAHGTLNTDLPPVSQALAVSVVGNSTDFFLRFPDVIRFGAQYTFGSRLLVEADVVAELWSELKTIEIRPQNIHVTTPATDRTLANIIFQKDYQDAVSIRVGADYELLPSRLTVRAGYLHETSAIPLKSVSVDFGNWQRDAVSVGGTMKIWRGLNASVAYAHHFVADQNVTNSQVVQVITPCSVPGCTDTATTVVGNGVYKASLDVASLSLGVILDDFRARPYVTSP